MQVVCEATQCNSVPVSWVERRREEGIVGQWVQLGGLCCLPSQVQVAALQNLVKIMSLYYQYMESYMGPALFAVSRVCV